MLDVEETPLNLFQSHGSSGSYNEFDIYASASLAKKRQRTYSRWSPIEEGVTLVWENLSVYSSTTKNGQMQHKQIINGVTGAVKAGSLVAIMGSSGAGKSTLMTALGYRTEGSILTEGNILINGRQIGDYMKYLSGFMHQEDMLLSYLTVREHMNIMANLKLDRRLSGNDKKQLIYDILRQLGLMKCIDLKIGGIDQAKSLSGGEKKRLAFATELLTDPPLLFCDEPTTGLDSYSAQKLVVIMNQMAITGKTILCTIHQPSSDIFAMFSQLILVADGRIAYMGSTNNALDFFERMGYVCPTSYNPADFYIKTLSTTPGYEDNCRQTVKRICDQFAVSDEAKEVEIVVQYELHMGRVATQRKFELRQNFKEIRWLSKLFWLTYRWILEIYRNPSLEAMKIAQRMLPGFILEPLIFVITAYWLAGLRTSGYAFLMTLSVIVLTMNVSSACGVMFSNAFDSVPTALAYLVPFDYAHMITSGVFVKLSTLPLVFSWIKYLSWLMYSTEALYILQWKDVTNITCVNPPEGFSCMNNGQDVLARYDFKETDFQFDIFGMLVLLLCFYILGYFFLWRRVRYH
ncbi:protein scarlet isoform X2 [Diabrotica virgifera virgifera]|uniref:ABC transporter domain-containing protein n=1 Tax=Diabrotica virgifera virgifera TaxID=50390 RepID=A0ABM5IFE9_DIAVI|nr:protein scarlet isoform X2 [Diabrotica virgifera virgifera]